MAATATETKSKRGGGEKAGEVLTAQVSGAVNVGEKVTSIGLRLGKQLLTLPQADKLLTGARLDVRMQGIMSGEDPDQRHLWNDAVPAQRTVEAYADCVGFSVRDKHLAFRLAFATSEVEVVDALLALKGAEVRCSFQRMGDAGEPLEGEGDDEGAE